LATYCLNNLSNYITLYDISKTFMWIPTKWVKPIIHRNLVFQLIRKKNYLTLRDLEINDSNLNALNRQNSYGQSPLNFALENEDCDSVAVLLKRGVKVERDSRDYPLKIAFNNNDLKSLQYLLNHDQAGKISIDEIEKYYQTALKEGKEACMHLLTIEKYKTKKLLMDIPESVFDWFQKPENYISSSRGFGNPLENERAKEKEQEIEISRNGEKAIQSITVYTNNSRNLLHICGLEVLWSDGSLDKLGLDKTDQRITETKVVTAPDGGHFSYVRGRAGSAIDAIAFDTELSNGEINRGLFIGGRGGDEVHSLECFDVKHLSIKLVGIKGHLNAWWAGLVNLKFNYRIERANRE